MQANPVFRRSVGWTMIRRFIVTCLSILLVACATHGTSDGDPMEEHLADANEELGRHHGAVMGAMSLSDVVEEASMHDSNMGRIMGGMDGVMNGMMSRCSGHAMRDMTDEMSNMHAEMQDHFGALERATDLGSARALCETHVAEMHEMLAGMHDALDRTGCGMMAR